MKIYSSVYQNGNSLFTETFKTVEGALDQLLEDVVEYTEGDASSIKLWDCTVGEGGRLFCVYDDFGFVVTIFETELD